MKLKEASEKQHVFTALACVGVAVMASLGAYSFVNPCDGMMLSDLASAFGDAFAVRHYSVGG